MWNRKHRRLVGRIILSNFLELSPDRFERYIEKVEKSPLFIKLSSRGIIKMETLSGAFVARSSVDSSQRAVAKINNNKRNLMINYTREGFSRKYIIVNEESKADPVTPVASYGADALRLLSRLRHITSRNEITHKILNGILEYQKDYFLSENSLNLKPLTLTDFARTRGIETSWLSRAIKGKTIITSQNKEVPMKFFFHKRKKLKKKLIKGILAQEKMKSKRPYSDDEIVNKVKNICGISVSRRSVASYRKELGIPSFWRRENCTYLQFKGNFSSFYPFSRSSIGSDVAESSGVYELRLAKGEIGYINCRTGIFYIGSARNIKKRLKEHLKSRNGNIKKILKKHKCLFRYIVFKKDWKEEEKRLYNLFLSTYGMPPKCNKVSP